MSTVTRQNLISSKDNYSGEALALQKLIMPFITCERVGKENIPDETPLKVPDNNPFRIKRPEEISLIQRENPTEQVLIVSNEEYMDVRMNPDNFQEERSEILSSKRKFQTICSDQVETSDDQVSAVTVIDVEDTDISCWNVASQESVNSKDIKGAALKGRGANEKKSKRSSSKKTGNKSKNCTILNFFSRV